MPDTPFRQRCFDATRLVVAFFVVPILFAIAFLLVLGARVPAVGHWFGAMDAGGKNSALIGPAVLLGAVAITVVNLISDGLFFWICIPALLGAFFFMLCGAAIDVHEFAPLDAILGALAGATITSIGFSIRAAIIWRHERCATCDRVPTEHA